MLGGGGASCQERGEPNKQLEVNSWKERDMTGSGQTAGGVGLVGQDLEKSVLRLNLNLTKNIVQPGISGVRAKMKEENTTQI